MAERMAQVRFAFKLTGAGWADGNLAIGQKAAGIECSYLSDALADFARAVIALLRGADQAACDWYDEPGTLGWRFTRQGQRVHVSTIAFQDTFNKRPDGEGTRNELGMCTMVELATAVRDGMKEVLDTWGLKGYRHTWQLYNFPMAEYKMLDTLVRDISENE